MSDPIVLNDAEARVLGVLIEKQHTTPDNYPLTLNALGAGCSQKSNRDPVQVFTESEVVVALQGLLAKHLAHKVAQSSARVEKWGHGAREALGLERAELSVLAELLLMISSLSFAWVWLAPPCNSWSSARHDLPDGVGPRSKQYIYGKNN